MVSASGWELSYTVSINVSWKSWLRFVSRVRGRYIIMNWDQIVDKITPHIVKIETQSGHGTGFLFLYNENKTFCGIATALHVVRDADNWQQPIRIRHHLSGEPVFLEASHRVIYTDWETDSAVILFKKNDFLFFQKIL